MRFAARGPARDEAIGWFDADLAAGAAVPRVSVQLDAAVGAGGVARRAAHPAGLRVALSGTIAWRGASNVAVPAVLGVRIHVDARAAAVLLVPRALSQTFPVRARLRSVAGMVATPAIAWILLRIHAQLATFDEA